MATIANLTVKADDSLEGTLAMLNEIAIIPNGRKSKDSESQNASSLSKFCMLRFSAASNFKLNAPPAGSVYRNPFRAADIVSFL